MTIDQQFAAFDANHPDVYRLFVQFAHELAEHGLKKYSADAILHRIRWHYVTSASAILEGREFKINNNYSSRYARKLSAEYPRFNGFFAFRKLKS
jgi:tRNA A37 threonylcarbamoyladenosine biosynthesis protein TsaE